MANRNETWADVARNTREAMALPGRPVTPRCLPGEAEPCGASFEQHALAHLATIRAICDHQLEHLGAPDGWQAEHIYRHELEELRRCEG